MPKLVAIVPEDTKKWLQWQALKREVSVSLLVNEALEDYRESVGGDLPSELMEKPNEAQASKA